MGVAAKILRTVANVVGVLLVAIFLPVMIVSLALLVKSWARPNEVPTFFGMAVLMVQSQSMEPEILYDDVIFTRKTAAKNLKEGDVVSFLVKGDDAVVTHRVVAITKQNGALRFLTKGDANITADGEPLSEDRIVGRYFARLAGAGKFAVFLMQPIGLVVCVAIPLALFLAYDMVRRLLIGREKRNVGNAEKEELTRLRALAARALPPTKEEPDGAAPQESDFEP